MATTRRDSERGVARRVVVHDFAGHPFQVQLARALARHGVEATHLYCPSFLTPKGNVDEGPDELDARFSSRGVALRRPFAKYSGPRRLLQEIEYGFRISREVRRLRPDAVVSANTPLIAAVIFQLAMLASRVPVVFWQQDVYSVAMATHLEGRLGWPGRAVGRVLIALEKWILRTSRAIVVISEDFVETLQRWGIDTDRVSVVENWAPLDELPIGCRPNPWSERHHITEDQTVLLYAGTLGLKHEPSVLLELADAMSDRPDVRVIVASEGQAATWLDEQRPKDGRLELLPFQPYSDLPDMLASADVLLVLLEADAGTFSVPSKVLTYHCAGRPVLGAMPRENLASRTIVKTGSGLVVPPGDGAALAAAARQLVVDPEERAVMGKRARSYAESKFDIDVISERFLDILSRALGGS